MKVSFLERAAHFLTKQRRHSYWLAAVACLALAVMTGTVYSLIRQGQASVYMEKTLACPVTVHVHGADCYDESGQLICGYADYVVHTHNDDCYDAGGQLVCQLGEAEEHVHDASCWEVRQELACGLEENPGHQHSEACYAPGTGCTLPEHVHTDTCYTVEWVPAEPQAMPAGDIPADALPAEDGTFEAPQSQEPQMVEVRTLTCTLAEHTHSESCQGEPVLICDMEVGAGSHFHGPECYRETQVLACGKNELHTHTDACYENGMLVCGKLELRSHVHDENCFRIHKLDEDEVAGLTPGGDDGASDTPEVPETPDTPDAPAEGHRHTDACYSPAALTCNQEEHAHTESCYTAETREVPVILEDGTVTTELQEVTVLTCTKTEHTHTDACYAGERTLICGLEETLPSTPEDPSQTPETPEVPDTPDTPGVPADPNAPHHHTDACYAPMDPICGLEEHAHGGDCIKSDTLEYICGKIEHTHTDECYPEPRTLICGLEEGQIPGEEKPEEKPVEQPVEMGTWFTAATVENDSQMTQAIVRCTAEAGIPADAELHIRRVEDGAELDSQARQAREITGQMGMEEVELSFYDIGFTWQGQEIEPKVPVTVELHWFGADAQEISATTAMIHYGSSGPEVVDHYLVEDGVVFETDGFSNYAVVKKARAATSSDLAGFTTQVTIKGNDFEYTIGKGGQITDENGVVVTDPKLYVGETYKINIYFAEDAQSSGGGGQFDPNSMTYQIPGILSCNAVSGPLSTTEGTELGTYTIDENGQLTVNLTESGKGAVERWQDTKMNVEFEATVVKNDHSQSENFDFGDNIKVDIKVENDAQVEVTKGAHRFDPVTRTIEYDVTAKVVRGAVDQLILEDYLEDYLNNEYGYFKIQDEGFTVTDLNGNSLEDKGYTVTSTISHDGRFEFRKGTGSAHKSSEKATITVSGGNGFQAGEGVKLNYKVHVEDKFFEGKDDLTVVTGSVMNQIDLTGKTGDDSVKVSDRATQTIKTVRLNKTCAEETSSGNIQWTVIVGDGYMPVSGETIMDTLKENSGMAYNTVHPIEVYPIRMEKNEVVGNNGPKQEYAWNSNNVSHSANSFSIRLPSLNDGYNAFKLVYYTTKPKNFNPSDNSVTIGGITTNGGGTPAIVKTGEDAGSYLEYTIEVDVPAGMKDKNIYIDDALKNYSNSSGGYQNNPENLVVTVTPEGGSPITLTEGRGKENSYYYRKSSSNPNHYRFYIGFNVPEKGDYDDGKWPYDTAATIQIVYRIPTSAQRVDGTNIIENDPTVDGALTAGETVRNRATVHYQVGDVYETKEGAKDIGRVQAITKSGTQMEDGKIHYVVDFPNGAINNSVVGQNVSDIWLEDSFDSRLQYVEGSMIMYFYDKKNGVSDRSNRTFVYKGNIDCQQDAEAPGRMKFKVNATNFWQRSDDNPDYISNNTNFIIDFNKSTTRYKAKSIRFEYDLEPRAGQLGQPENGSTTVSLNNDARIGWKDSSGADHETALAHATVEYNVGVLDKYGEQIDEEGKGAILRYTIELNRSRLQLAKQGQKTYNVKDTMSSNLAVKPDTIAVEKGEVDGSWSLLEKGRDYTVSFSTSGQEQVITFTGLPDKEYLKITYEARVTGTDANPTVNNTAVLQGSVDYTTVDNASYDINRSNSGISGTAKTILLTKSDALTGVNLPGAQFALYTAQIDMRAPNPPKNVAPEILVPVVDQDGNMTSEHYTLYYRGSYRTGPDGTIMIGIGNKDNGDAPLTSKVLYALVEVEPPAGYVKSEKRTYFYVDEKSDTWPLYGVESYNSGSFISIPNTPTGYELPETGSDGSMKYVALGALLMCGGGLLAVRRGRKRRA